MTHTAFRALGSTVSALALALGLASAPAAAQGVAEGARTGARAGQNTLDGQSLGPPQDLRPVSFPSPDGRFCHWLEKSNAEGALRRAISDVSWNVMQWEHLSFELSRLQARTSDAAARARIGAAIRNAKTNVEKGDADEARLREMLQSVITTPVNDCGVPNTESLTLATGSRYDFAIGQPAMLPVHVPPTIPDQVCHPGDKETLIEQTSKARFNAGANLDQWRIRRARVEQAQRAGDGDAVKLEQARHEASLQMELWSKELEKARAADERAAAIRVVGCLQRARASVSPAGGYLAALTSARAAMPAPPTSEPGAHLADYGPVGGLAGSDEAERRLTGRDGDARARLAYGPLAPFASAGAEWPFDGSEAEQRLHGRMEPVAEPGAHLADYGPVGGLAGADGSGAERRPTGRDEDARARLDYGPLAPFVPVGAHRPFDGSEAERRLHNRVQPPEGSGPPTRPPAARRSGPSRPGYETIEPPPLPPVEDPSSSLSHITPPPVFSSARPLEPRDPKATPRAGPTITLYTGSQAL